MNRNLEAFKGKRLSGVLADDVAFWQTIFAKDAVFRRRCLQIGGRLPAALCFFDGMVNNELLTEGVLKPLLRAAPDSTGDALERLEQTVVGVCEVTRCRDVYEMLAGLLGGDTLLMVDGYSNALLLGTKGYCTRGISEPSDERVTSGPREGFDESFIHATALLRRKLATPDLCFETVRIGRKTDTVVCLAYLDSVVKPGLVNIIKRRLARVDIDGVLDSHYLTEQLSGCRLSLFKTVGSTERPDIVAARLLEGRVAVLVGGTPAVLTLPYLYAENFQSDDDYYTGYLVAAIGRVLRYVCFYTAICLPALYMAVTVFQPSLLPAAFFIRISAARSGVPFSSFGETLLLLILFEVIKETSMRMPQSGGNAMSVVGGLVVGQATIEAGIVSAPVLIVTALCGIGSLMLPRLRGALFYWQLLLLIAASLLGLYGFFIGLTVMHLHLYSLTSFGVNYVAPGLTFTKQSVKDTLIRAPWPHMIRRPVGLSRNRIRQRRNL